MISNMSRQYHDYFYFQAMTTYDSLIEPPVLKSTMGLMDHRSKGQIQKERRLKAQVTKDQVKLGKEAAQEAIM